MILASAPPPHGGIGWFDYLAVLAYLAVTVGIIAWSARQQKSTDDFFLGGRSMPWFAVGLSLMATLLSTNTYLGNPGEMIKYGVVLFIGYLGIPLAMIVVMLAWIPCFMRLRLTSAYEYLELRFDARTRWLGSTLFLFLRLGWMAMVLYTASLALARMTHVPMVWVIGVVGVAATIFTCLGGIKAVIWTDVLQAVMLFGGVFVIIAYVWYFEGAGPGTWWSIAAGETKAHTRPTLFSWDLTERMTIATAMLHWFCWTVCTHGSDQVALQRYFSTTSLSAARRSYVVNTISSITINVLLALAGLALWYFYRAHADYLPQGLSLETKADEVMPYFYAHQLFYGLGGLVLASFLCDAMQTLVSGVNSITATATHDVFTRLRSAGNAGVSELNVARLLTVLLGIVSTLLAYGVAFGVAATGENIVDLMPRMFNMFLGPLASLFLVGLFNRRATVRSALPAGLLALAVSIAWSWWDLMVPGAQRPTFTLAIALPYATGYVVALVLSRIVEHAGEHSGQRYTWRAIMSRPLE